MPRPVNQARGVGTRSSTRLTGVSRSGDPQSFTPDQVGNRLAHVRAGLSYNYAMAPGTNRIASVSGATSRAWGYDALGNVTSKTGSGVNRAYTHDAFNRLAGFYSQGVHTGAYYSNALNQRMHKATQTHSTQYATARRASCCTRAARSPPRTSGWVGSCWGCTARPASTPATTITWAGPR